jgi:hypothetical protein
LLLVQLQLPLPAAVLLLPVTVVPTQLLLLMTLLLMSLQLLLLLMLLSGCCNHSHAMPFTGDHTAAYTLRPGYFMCSAFARALAWRCATVLLPRLPFASTIKNLLVPSVNSMSPTRQPLSPV